MASLRELVVSITAKTAAFEQKVEGASKRLNKFGKDTKAIRSQLGAMFGGVSIAGFGYLVKSAIDAGDQMQKMSQQLGISTAALSQLDHAAQLSGTNLEAVSVGIKMMEKNIGDAKRGTGEAIVAFNQLGISAERLGQLTPDQQMAVLADALKKVENPADKASIAMKIFGESGVKLLPMLKDGSAGLTAMMAEADALGLTLAQDTANGMAAFNDSVTRAKAMMNGWVREIAGNAAPVFTWLVEVLGDTVPRAGKAFMGVLNFMRGELLMLYSAISAVVSGLASLGEWAAGKLGFDGAAASMGKFADSMAETSAILSDQASFEFDSAGERIVAAVMPAIKGFDELAGTAATVPAALDDVAGHTETLAEKTKKAADAQKAFNDMVKEAQGFIDKTRTPLEEYQGQMTRLAELFESGAFDSLGGLETYQQTVERMAQEFKDSMDSATQQGEGKIDELTKIGEEGAKSMRGAMEDFFMNPTKEGFDQLLQSFLQTIAQMAAEAAAAQLTQALFGGSSGGSSSGLGSLISGIVGGFSAHANGGPIIGGQPIMVGERGPELIVPAGAGNVIPNERLGGGGGQNIVMNISTPNADSFRRSEQQITTEYARRLQGARRNM